MKRVHLVLSIFILISIIDIFLYIYQPLGENFFIIGDTTVAILSFLSFIFGLYAYKLHGFSSLQGKALILLSIGMFFWFLGESTWGIYEVVLGLGKPIVSMADVFWLIGYPFFLLGLYFVWKIVSAPISKGKSLVLIVLVLSVCLFIISLAMPNLANAETSITEKMSTVGYVIGDMLLLVASIVVTIYIFGGKFARTWGLILLAILTTTVADIYYMNFLEVYETGNLIDILWDLSYILFAFGFFYHRETVKGILKAALVKKN